MIGTDRVPAAVGKLGVGTDDQKQIYESGGLDNAQAGARSYVKSQFGASQGVFSSSTDEATTALGLGLAQSTKGAARAGLDASQAKIIGQAIADAMKAAWGDGVKMQIDSKDVHAAVKNAPTQRAPAK